jgi:hypothetical protein
MRKGKILVVMFSLVLLTGPGYVMAQSSSDEGSYEAQQARDEAEQQEQDEQQQEEAEHQRQEQDEQQQEEAEHERQEQDEQRVNPECPTCPTDGNGNIVPPP